MIGCRTKESGNGSMKIIEFQVCNCFVELSLGAPKGTNSQAKGDWGLFQAHSRILSHPVINSSTTMMTGVWLWQTGGVLDNHFLSGFSWSVKQIQTWCKDPSFSQRPSPLGFWDWDIIGGSHSTFLVYVNTLTHQRMQQFDWVWTRIFTEEVNSSQAITV